MERILIPQKRADVLRRIMAKTAKALGCRLELNEDNEVVIDGDPYEEYNAKNVIQAFGRGFPMNTAYKLIDEGYFFKYINLKDVLRNEDQIRRIKARIIGSGGKAKEYVQGVSGASMAVYGNTIGLIGTNEQVEIAMGALKVLIDGGTHKKEMQTLEGIRRKYREGGAV
ncbi:MAG: hypothetical protein M1321_00880 [Candidatus Marsarchaeota archaeon]|nr:hypothetical protein [Candidatus Marsarchaeota archaeon]